MRQDIEFFPRCSSWRIFYAGRSRARLRVTAAPVRLSIEARRRHAPIDLDTQLKRLGSPNFTHLPINAPKCPFAHFQQDGHMAMRNPGGRANYEPNSWG